jgi:hypothetical protein
MKVKKFLLFVPLHLLLGVMTVLGCSCVPSPFKETAFRADIERGVVIFSGLAEKVETASPHDKKDFDKLTQLKVVFKVEKIWNKKTTREIIINQTAGRFGDGIYWNTGCGFIFEEGKRYLVFTKPYGKGLTVSFCSETKLLEKAQEDVKLLNKILRQKRSKKLPRRS